MSGQLINWAIDDWAKKILLKSSLAKDSKSYYFNNLKKFLKGLYSEAATQRCSKEKVFLPSRKGVLTEQREANIIITVNQRLC